MSHTPDCLCNTAPQTSEHILQSCPLYREARNQFLAPGSFAAGEATGFPGTAWKHSSLHPVHKHQTSNPEVFSHWKTEEDGCDGSSGGNGFCFNDLYHHCPYYTAFKENRRQFELWNLQPVFVISKLEFVGVVTVAIIIINTTTIINGTVSLWLQSSSSAGPPVFTAERVHGSQCSDCSACCHHLRLVIWTTTIIIWAYF